MQRSIMQSSAILSFSVIVFLCVAYGALHAMIDDDFWSRLIMFFSGLIVLFGVAANYLKIYHTHAEKIVTGSGWEVSMAGVFVLMTDNMFFAMCLLGVIVALGIMGAQKQGHVSSVEAGIFVCSNQIIAGCAMYFLQIDLRVTVVCVFVAAAVNAGYYFRDTLVR